jgi:hypothetical protein
MLNFSEIALVEGKEDNSYSPNFITAQSKIESN